jgi:two-component system sensor histidine kinase RstB
VLFAAVAAGAWPVVRRLTRRLEALKQGVEAFGAGALHQRVAEEGRDEVAALAPASTGRHAHRGAAASHKSLLANASHELRSPLARLKMALDAGRRAAPAQRAALRPRSTPTSANSTPWSRRCCWPAGSTRRRAWLEARANGRPAGLAAEEAARVGAEASGEALTVMGDERLVRRALRNLLENARRYGGARSR